MKPEDIMFCAILGIGFVYLFLVTLVELPPTGLEHSKTICGFILGSVISILVGYKWGSSSGSEAKSKLIEKQSDEKTKQLTAQNVQIEAQIKKGGK